MHPNTVEYYIVEKGCTENIKKLTEPEILRTLDPNS